MVMLTMLLLLLPIATSAMATASLCGVASGLPITSIMTPIFILAVIIAAILFFIAALAVHERVPCDCDPQNSQPRLLMILLFVSGFLVVAALVVGPVLIIVKVDGHLCFTWGLVGAVFLLLIVSGFGFLFVASFGAYDE